MLTFHRGFSLKGFWRVLCEVCFEGCMENGVTLTMQDSPHICHAPNTNNNGDISNSNNVNKVLSHGVPRLICLFWGIIYTRLEKHFPWANILVPPYHSRLYVWFKDTTKLPRFLGRNKSAEISTFHVYWVNIYQLGWVSDRISNIFCNVW